MELQFGDIAQWLERNFHKVEVECSIHSIATSDNRGAVDSRYGRASNDPCYQRIMGLKQIPG